MADNIEPTATDSSKGLDAMWACAFVARVAAFDRLSARVAESGLADALEESALTLDVLVRDARIALGVKAAGEGGLNPTWTFVGHWDNDRIVVEYVLDGRVEDDREDDGSHEQGLWAASGSGATVEEAQAAAIAEYEQG